MGAAIATILTYILRENEKLSSSTCIAFGPGTALRSIVYFEQHKLKNHSQTVSFTKVQYLVPLKKSAILACCHNTMSCAILAFPFTHFIL